MKGNNENRERGLIMGLFDAQRELSTKLEQCPTDKDKVKLLLKTLEGEGNNGTLESFGLRMFAIGYFGSLLTKHGLNDWE